MIVLEGEWFVAFGAGVVRVLRLASQEVVVLALVEDGGVFGHAAFSGVACIVYSWSMCRRGRDNGNR